MNKLDKQMFKILDEFVDRELKFGCIGEDDDGLWIKTNQGWQGVGEKYKSNWRAMDLDKKKIIGQYHLGTILQWAYGKIPNSNIRIGKGHICLSYKNRDYIFNTTTPPMERSTEQKQEFVDFANKVL